MSISVFEKTSSDSTPMHTFWIVSIFMLILFRFIFNAHFMWTHSKTMPFAQLKILTKIWSMTNRSTSNPLYSAFDSAFFNNWSKKSADFFGQRPCVVPHCLAWAHRPTPPLKFRNGTHSFFSTTFFKKRCARRNGIFLIAWAASWVF